MLLNLVAFRLFQLAGDLSGGPCDFLLVQLNVRLPRPQHQDGDRAAILETLAARSIQVWFCSVPRP